MKRNIRVGLFIFIFSLSPFIPVLNAEPEVDFFNPEVTISMDFQDAKLKDVLKVFSVQSGLNFIASDAVQDRTVTLYLDKVSIREAMNKILKANNLTYELDPDTNIFVVKDWGKPQIETITRVFYLQYLSVPSAKIKGEIENNLKGDSGEGGMAAGAGQTKTQENADIVSSIKNVLSEYGKISEDPRTNCLIVTDIPSRIPVVSQLIALLDIPVPQVLLEVEMLDVSKNAVDQLGIDWPSSLAKLDVTGSRVTNFPFESLISNKENTDSWAFSDITSPSGKWKFSALNGANFAPSVLTLIGSELALNFLRTQTDTKYLARPRLLTLNNETSEIKIATSEAIGVTQTTTGSATGGLSSSSAEAERADTGVVLRVTPQANVETGEITMFIYPKVADATQGSTFVIAGTNYQYRNPEERSTKSVVRIKDGETVIIGGMLRHEVVHTIRKIPILGDIPFFGYIFKREGDTTSDKNKERELLVFITPHIIKDNNMQQVAQAKKAAFTDREQSAALQVVDRQTLVNASLNNFERRMK